jgi:N-acetylglutamate synthase-like GNAT family acetyltransferase
MNNFEIRPATKQDFPTIRSLVSKARINPTGLGWERFWVAEAAGEVVGCGQVKPHKDGSRELASLVVHPAWRGRGLARTLIEHFLEIEEGPLYLTCRADLGPFYQKFGFGTVAVEEMPKYFRLVYKFINAGKLVGLEELRILVMASGNYQSD